MNKIDAPSLQEAPLELAFYQWVVQASAFYVLLQTRGLEGGNDGKRLFFGQSVQKALFQTS